MSKVLSFVCVYVCTIVGASFITGNEIFVYFAQFGTDAYLLLALCFIVFLISTLTICLKFNKSEKNSIVEIFETKSENETHKKNFFKILFKSLMFFTYFAFGAVMLAGIKELFGVLVCVCIVIVSFLLLQFDLSGLVKINVALFPVVCVYLIGLCFLVGNGNGDIIAYENANFIDFLNIFPYVTLNVVLICASLMLLTKRMSQKQIILSVVLSAVVFAVFILVQILILQADKIVNIEMPLIEIAQKNKIFYYFTLFVTFLAMLSSFLSSSFAVYTKTKNSKSKYFNLSLILMLMLFCSFLGFSKLITLSYFVLGVLSTLLIFVLMFKKF